MYFYFLLRKVLINALLFYNQGGNFLSWLTPSDAFVFRNQQREISTPALILGSINIQRVSEGRLEINGCERVGFSWHIVLSAAQAVVMRMPFVRSSIGVRSYICIYIKF